MGAIRKSPRWSAYYDAGRRLEAAASRDALGAPQLEHIESMLFAELDRHALARRTLPRWRTGGALLVPAAAAVALLVVTSDPAPPADSDSAVVDPAVVDPAVVDPGVDPGTDTPPPALDESGRRADAVLTERGMETAPPAGLRVHCLSADGKRVVSTADVGPREPLDALGCPGDGLLGFSVTNLHDDELFLFLVGLSGRDVRWYAPFTARAASARLAPGTRNEPLPVLADTAPFPAGEEVTLYALFSARPLSGADVERQLAAAARAHRLDSAADRLPVATDWQGRVEVRPPQAR